MNDMIKKDDVQADPDKVHAAEYAWADRQVDYGKIRQLAEEAHLTEDSHETP